jgi:hypothetical protein
MRLIAKLGSITVTLTLTGEYTYANDFEVRLRPLIDLTNDLRLGGTGLIFYYGEIYRELLFHKSY